MQAIDPTGQLPLMGQSFAQTPPPDISLPYSTKTTVEFGFKFGMPYLKKPRNTTGSLEASAIGDVLPSPSSSACSSATAADSDLQASSARFTHDSDVQGSSPHSSTDLSTDVPTSFIEMTAIWTNLAAAGLARQISDDILPGFACDTYVIKTDDPLSNAITSFRDGARRMISAGMKTSDVIGDSVPCLEAFFGHNDDMSMTAWSGACQIANASSHQSFTFRLALVYVAGIQMRFFIAPSAETYDDLPPMLRPLSKQYTVPHMAGIDICHFPAFKNFLLSNRDHYKNVLLEKQSCNWPYSDAACLVYAEKPGKYIKTSQAFIEHVRTLTNYSVDQSIVERVPQMACHIQH